jgi:hypothetical protein
MQHSYVFNQMGRANNEPVDITQTNLSNQKYSNYALSQFAFKQPEIMESGMFVKRGGATDKSVMFESYLHQPLNLNEQKLQLSQRLFTTVPYLGKGSSNPVLESQLQQGEIVREKPSISTVSEQSFLNYSMYPTDDVMKEHVKNTTFTVEESAMDGWVRGGQNTRR